MQPPDCPSPSARSLIASWLSLTAFVLRALAGKAQEMAEKGADAVKDTLLDLGSPASGDRDEPAGWAPLPAVRPEELIAALREQTERVLREEAEAIDEGACGCCEELAEARVLALFAELGEEALDQAHALRVAAAADRPSEQQPAFGEWAKKYRRMLATEGRWPAREEVPSPGPTETTR